MIKLLESCNLCPHNCGVNRIKGEFGWCKSGADFYVSSVCLHRGEEPVISGIKGICNVFFAHCNMQCVYCQNYQISDNKTPISNYLISCESIVNQIIKILKNNINILGFVSPTHFVPQMILIIQELNKRGYKPTIVYNTNAYDNVETLKLLENYVDVYLPDFKYIDNNIALKYSKISNYSEIAKKSIYEMYRQKGSSLIVNDSGYAESGLLIRHLVIPNYVNNSIEILKYIAEEISTNVHISLMSQYYPTYKTFEFKEINRKIYETEYNKVVKSMEEYGLYNGYIQDIDSFENYKPDFEKKHPFEEI